MSRKPRPPAINLEAAIRNAKWIASKKGMLWLWRSIFYLSSTVEKGEVSETAEALHSLHLLRRAREMDGFSEQRWRETIRAQGETVEIPKQWADTICAAWERYVLDTDGLPVAEAFDLHRTKHRSDARTAGVTLTTYLNLAVAMQHLRIEAVANGEIISLEETRSRLLLRLSDEKPQDDFSEQYSEETLRRAWARWGDLIERMTALESHPDAKPR